MTPDPTNSGSPVLPRCWSPRFTKSTSAGMLLTDPIAGSVVREAVDFLRHLFGEPSSRGSQMAARAAAPLEPEETIAASCSALAHDLLRTVVEWPISRRGSARQMTIWIKEDEPVRKIQVTIDDKTERLLEALAVPRAGNKSFVVREAVRRMAEQEGFEQYLDWLEQQPDVRVSLEGARADEHQGRTVSHEQVLRRLQKSRRR